MALIHHPCHASNWRSLPIIYEMKWNVNVKNVISSSWNVTNYVHFGKSPEMNWVCTLCFLFSLFFPFVLMRSFACRFILVFNNLRLALYDSVFMSKHKQNQFWIVIRNILTKHAAIIHSFPLEFIVPRPRLYVFLRMLTPHASYAYQ